MYGIVLFIVSFLSSPIFANFSRQAAAAQESGNPWWIWILVFLAFFAFFILFLWWFVRSHGEEEEETAPAPARQTVAAVPAGEEAIGPEAGALDTTRLEGEEETIALPESETETTKAIEAEVLEPAKAEDPAGTPIEAGLQAAVLDEAEDSVETRVEAAPEPDTIAGTATPESPPAAQPQQPDNLKRVEGIGPKIASVLQAAGITTFAQLAGTDSDTIRQILEEENPNLVRLADPTSWPAQARLAADGKWDELQQLQDTLRGGRAR